MASDLILLLDPVSRVVGRHERLELVATTVARWTVLQPSRKVPAKMSIGSGRQGRLEEQLSVVGLRAASRVLEQANRHVAVKEGEPLEQELAHARDADVI